MSCITFKIRFSIGNIRNDDEIRRLIWLLTTAYADVVNSLRDLEISKTEFSEIAGAKLD